MRVTANLLFYLQPEPYFKEVLQIRISLKCLKQYKF